MLRQVARVARRAVARQIGGRCHAQTPVVGDAHAHQGRIGQVAHAHRAVEPLAGQIDHAVAQVERDGHLGMQVAKARHQRCHVAPAEARRRGDAQVPGGLHAAGGHAGLGIRHVGQQALAIFEKGAALVREVDAPRGAHHELHPQVLFQRIEPAPHDGGGHAFGLGGGGEAAARCHRHE